MLFGLLPLAGQEDTSSTTIEDTVQAMSEEGMVIMDYPADINSPLDDGSVEKTSYNLYLKKQWVQLSSYCERAIGSGFDYFYLRVRAGVAYFERRQYRKAIVHLKKALEFNSDDDFAASYLYYAYLYSERFEEAKWLSKDFSPSLRNSLQIKPAGQLDYVMAESGIKSPDSSRLFKRALFTDLGVAHSIANRLFLFHGITYFAQNEARFSVQQFQYYLRGSVPFKNGFLLNAGLHLVDVAADVRNFVPVVNTNTYVVYPVGPAGMPPPPAQVVTITTNGLVEQVNAKSTQNYVGAISLTKRTVFADYVLGATAGNFDTTTQVQVMMGANFYPFKNSRFSAGFNAYVHAEQKSPNSSVAITPYINAYLAKKVHLSLSYFNNQGPNISENTGSFVSNSVDYTPQRIAGTVSFELAEGAWLYGTYAYEQKKHLAAGYQYDYNIFVVGIKFFP